MEKEYVLEKIRKLMSDDSKSTDGRGLRETEKCRAG